jgi:heat shock protein HtpX
MAKWMMGVKIVTAEGPHRELVLTVHRLAAQDGIKKMPEVGIYEADELNAFATGPSKNNSLVAVSSGLLNRMNKAEVEGVLAHEIAHIANGDMITMALVQAMRGDKEESNGLSPIAHMFLVLALDIFFGILASPVVAWFSRYREFRADQGGAVLEGKEKMMMALEALERAHPQLAEIKNNNGSQYQSLQISSKEKQAGDFLNSSAP